MKNLKHFIVACALWSLAWFGIVQPVTWVSNLFAFITWVGLVLFIVGLQESQQKRIRQSYRDGKHAPLWFDNMTYWPLILTCAAMGHFAKALAWLVCLSIDLAQRQLSKEEGDAKP